MKKVSIILIIIFLAVVSIFIIQNYNQTRESKSTNIFALDIKGSNKINDNEFKKVVLDFILMDIKRDYLNQYKSISTFYLKKYYKGIISAEEYQKIEKKSELIVLGYSEIIACKLLNDNKYQVDLIRKDGFEGEEYIKKVRYYFIKEKNMWKLFDSDLLE